MLDQAAAHDGQDLSEGYAEFITHADARKICLAIVPFSRGGPMRPLAEDAAILWPPTIQPITKAPTPEDP